MATFLNGCNSGDLRQDVTGSNGSQQSGILSWLTPTIYIDGTSIDPADIKEYKIYYRTESDSYSANNYLQISAPTTSIALSGLNLPSGIFYVVVTAVVTDGLESDFSNEVVLK